MPAITQTAWIALGAFAALVSYVGIRGDIDVDKRTLFSLLSVVLWGAFALYSFDVVQVTNSGTEIHRSYLGLAALAGVFAAIMFIYFLRGLKGELEEDMPQEFTMDP